MLFVHPDVLWLLLLAPAVAAIGWRASKRWLVAITRVACLALIAIAAAGPLWMVPANQPVRVTVIDLSPTMSDASIATAIRADPDSIVIGVSNRAGRLTDPSELLSRAGLARCRQQLSRPLYPDDPAGGGAALADGLRLAGGLIPPGQPADITLVTNGLCSRGDAAAEALRLANSGIAVHVNTAKVEPENPLPDMLIRSLAVPGKGSIGQTISARITLESIASGSAHLSLETGSGAPIGGDVPVHPGLTNITYPVPLTRSGMMTLRAHLPDQSAVTAAVSVAEAPTVLVVTDHQDGTAAALASSLGAAADVREISPEALDAPHALDDIAAVVLANLPADRLSNTAQTKLHDAVVRDGTSLLICGADQTFGPGGYADASALGAMLPVRMPRPAQQLDPSVALVLVIDTSGSMFGNRIDLAKEVSRLAINRLTPRDQAGIVEFFGNRRWASPLQTVGDKLEITRALDRLSAGGGTILYPAVEEAAFALRNTSARSRHVLILSDGDVENTPFETLVRQMAKDGITVSAGRCGNAGDEGDFLSNIAHWGHGRYYEVADRFALPDITFKRPRTLPLSPVVLPPQPIHLGKDPLGQTFAASAWPALGHYARTPAKPTADVLLSTDSGDPLVARWRYGSGWVVAMPFDLGSSTAAPLEASASFAPMLRSLLIDVAGDRQGLRIQPIVRPAGLEIAVEAARPAVLPTEPIEVQLLSGSTIVRTAMVQPFSADRWDALFPGITAGTYQVKATAGDAIGLAGVAIPQPRALSRLTPDTDLIAAIASPPGSAPPPAMPSPANPVELWIPFTLAALLCFLLHVAARRWPTRTVPAKPSATAPLASLAAMVVFCVSTTVHGAVTTQPIQQRIHAALLNDGDISELSRADLSAADRVMVAREQGDRAAEIQQLSRLAIETPDDANITRQLALAQEFNGNDDAARKYWERTLALGASVDADLHLGVLLLDDGQTEQGLAALSRAAAEAHPPSSAAGIIAALYGQDAAAIRLLADGDRTAEILRGEARLRLGQSTEAAEAFRLARTVATQASDQRYLAEREVAAARQAGTLDQLSGDWLGQGEKLPVACLGPLASILRDQGHAGPLLDWWSALAASSDPARREIALAPAMVAEVVGAAIDAGMGIQAETVTQQVVKGNPHSVAALASAVRVALDLGDAATADALLDAHAKDADSTVLRQVGDLAASLGRDAVAGRCADQLIALGGADSVAGLLLRSSLVQGEESVALLNKAAAIADASQVATVADALDVAGQRPTAIALLQRFTDSSNDVDLLIQLGWLLEKSKRSADAAAVYERMRLGADTDALREQAQQHVLDLAAHTGTLTQVRDTALARLQGGTGTKADLSLVVNADVRAGDPAAAVKSISASSVAGSAVDRLSWTADVWLRTEHLEEAASALDRLRQAQVDDPAAARLTLQRIAELDLRRNRPDLARQAVLDAARGSDGETAAMLLAGILSRSDAPQAAAHQYRRALAAAGPSSDADAWLPWAQAMVRAGHREQAIVRLQSLCAESAEVASDGALGVGVDGLLNLDAPAAALRPVRRLVILRVAAAPQRSIDAHLLADLSDQLRDASFGRRALAVGLAADSEQRSERLRTLVDAARSANDSDAALDFGRRLLATGDELPPSLFLDLGQQLLADGREVEAMRALDRATEVSADDIVRRRAALLTERAALPLASARLLAPLAARSPGDVALRVELGGQYEAAGQPDKAEAEYMAALDVALDRLPAEVRRGAESGSSGGGVSNVTPPRKVTSASRRLNVLTPPPAQLEDDVHLPLTGALACAADAQARDAVVQLVLRHANAVFTAGPQGKLAPVDVVALAAALRQAALTAQEPDVTDAFDHRLIAAWPADADLAATAVQTRLFYGLYDRAASMLRPGDPRPPVLDLRAAVASTRPSVATPPTYEWASLIAPQLLLRNRDAEGGELLAGLPSAMPATTPAASLLVVAVAHELGRQAQLDAIATALVNQIVVPRSGHQDVMMRANNLIAIWPVISPDLRRTFNDRLAAAAMHSTDPASAAQLARVVLATAGADGIARPDATRLAERVVNESLSRRNFYFDGLCLLELLGRVPVDQQAHIAELAMKNARPAERREWAMLCLSSSLHPLSASVCDVLVAAAISPAVDGPVDVEGNHHPTVLPWTPWFANADQPQMVRRLSDALVPIGSAAPVLGPPAPSAAPPVDPQTQVAVAIGRSMLGQTHEADTIGMTVIDRLRREAPVDPLADMSPRHSYDAVGSIPATHAALLRLATASLSPAARQRLASIIQSDVTAAISTGGWRAAADAMLLDALGRREDSLQVLRLAVRHNPRDPVVVAALVHKLREDGRVAELVALLRTRLYDTGSADPTLLPDLTNALLALGRVDEARRFTFATEEDPEAVGSVLHAAIDANDQVRANRAFHQLLVLSRGHGLAGSNAVGVSPTAIGIARPERGGMVDNDGQAPGSDVHRLIVTCIPASDGGGAVELTRQFDALPIGASTPVAAIGQMLATASSNNPATATELLAHLSQLRQRDALTTNHCVLLHLLSTTPGIHLPADLRGALLDAALTTATPVRQSLAADMSAQRDLAVADADQRWMNALRAATGRDMDGWFGGHDSEPFTPPAKVAVWPPPLPAMPRPADLINDLTESERLLGLMTAGHRQEAIAELSGLVDSARVSVLTHPELMLVRARMAADDQDPAEFGRRFSQVLNTWLWSNDDTLLDIHPALPSAGEAGDINEITNQAITAITSAADRFPGNGDLCRLLCIVGSWAQGTGDTAGATAALTAARSLRDRLGEGEYELWIADLASQIGKPDLAVNIQVHLLEEQRLPLARMQAVINDVRNRGDSTTADRLAAEVSRLVGPGAR